MSRKSKNWIEVNELLLDLKENKNKKKMTPQLSIKKQKCFIFYKKI